MRTKGAFCKLPLGSSTTFRESVDFDGHASGYIGSRLGPVRWHQCGSPIDAQPAANAAGSPRSPIPRLVGYSGEDSSPRHYR